jgi:acyl-CoA hydrolase
MPEACPNPESVFRTVAYSRTEQVHIIIPSDCNQNFRLFGGKLMEWVDIVAAVVARRHSSCDVTTAAIDRLDFLAPARLNDVVVMLGRIIFVGHTSMLVCVDTFVEDSSCSTVTRTLVNRAYLTMVALDKSGKPIAVPRLMLETDEEKVEYEIGRARQQASRHAPH